MHRTVAAVNRLTSFETLARRTRALLWRSEKIVFYGDWRTLSAEIARDAFISAALDVSVLAQVNTFRGHFGNPIAGGKDNVAHLLAPRNTGSLSRRSVQPGLVTCVGLFIGQMRMGQGQHCSAVEWLNPKRHQRTMVPA